MCAPCEKRHTLSKIPDSVWNFNSRLLCRERQCDHNNLTDAVCYFDPRPPRGGRRSRPPSRSSRPWNFNPRPPRGGRLRRSSGCSWPGRHFNPRPPRGGRLVGEDDVTAVFGPISIHAPLAGGDGDSAAAGLAHLYFNPRPPRGGRRAINLPASTKVIFQSTPPSRGATCAILREAADRLISIHAPLAGGDRGGPLCPPGRCISIHAPLAGGDLAIRRVSPGFLISIHAPLAGGDGVSMVLGLILAKFQSTPPSRGATQQKAYREANREFQSTPPSRGATEK